MMGEYEQYSTYVGKCSTELHGYLQVAHANKKRAFWTLFFI